MIRAGSRAPDFTLPADDGRPLTLSALRGHTVVLYFYPRDDTPTCTVQACELREAFRRIEAAGALVLGVSTDSTRSHARFRWKYALPFPLLADVDHAVAERYGVWQEKVLFGRRYLGIVRSTFVIDADGRVRRAFRNVKVAGHAAAVEAAVGAVAARPSPG